MAHVYRGVAGHPWRLYLKGRLTGYLGARTASRGPIALANGPPNSRNSSGRRAAAAVAQPDLALITGVKINRAPERPRPSPPAALGRRQQVAYPAHGTPRAATTSPDHQQTLPLPHRHYFPRPPATPPATKYHTIATTLDWQ